MSKRPTIHDVAARAGVSKSTAAVVFSSPEDVSPARREKVLAAAAELGYTPNAWARSLRSTSGGFVGIIVADLHNPLFTEIADAVRQKLAAKGLFSFVATASLIDGPDGKVLDQEPLQHLLDLKPSSLLIVGGLPDFTPFSRLSELTTVVVALASAPELPRAVSVRIDELTAMKLVCNHLSDGGHRVVTYVGPRDRPVAVERQAAFEQAAREHSMLTSVQSTGTSMDEASGAVAARLALDSSTRPTAIVCYNDNVACGVQNELYRQGITDVAVTGFDNTYIAGLERISLTSVAQNVDEMVDRSVAALTDPESTVTDVLVAPELVARCSTTAMNFLD